jgi:helicase
VKVKDVVSQYNLNPKITDILKKAGYDTLYPPQKTVLKSDVLKGKNFVLSMPTASGKTLIAELAMLKTVLQDKGKCLYVVPLKALASEKYEDFKKKYLSLGIKIAIATGDYNMPSHHLANYDIIIATSEKVDSLLRFRGRWLSEKITLSVYDEIHLIDDESRGPTLEILIARLKQLNPKMQVIGLSATIKNAYQIAKWLKAECFLSKWRPVPLKEGVFYNNTIRYKDNKTKTIKANSSHNISNFCFETIKKGGQVLVFVNTRRSTQSEARRIASGLGKYLSSETKKKLKNISKRILSSSTEPTKISKELSACIKNGVAFHHAGLTYKMRKIVEDNYKENIIKTICATPTLAYGVNLPARCVIIRDYKRFSASLGSYHIAVFEYKQMRGRAGRPKYDKKGLALLRAKSEDEQEYLLDEFVRSEPEPIISKLGQESALRSHVLSSISSGYIHTQKGLMEFLSHTFFAQQEDPENLDYIIEKIIDFLLSEEMITEVNGRFQATAFGNIISRLYIDPYSGVILKKGLDNTKKKKPNNIAFFHLVCLTPDMANLRLNKKIQDDAEMFFGLHNDGFLLPFDKYFTRSDYKMYLQTIVTTMMLKDWTDEIRENPICEKFSMGPGDIRRYVDITQWILYATIELARLFKMDTLIPQLNNLRTQVRYGIKEELLNLVSLKNVGRVRARSLYDNGIKRLYDLKKAEISKLMRLADIGKKTAESIKKQVQS